jgi:mannose-1-phosphate guanylyltransferase
MKNVYFITLCGGIGTRLWPLSRKDRPKQLLPFIENKSLLKQTIDRIAKNCDKKNIGVITSQNQAALIKKEIGNDVGIFLQEPTPRNTGPAILHSCLEIEKRDDNSIVVFLPADHFIPDTEKYWFYLQKAIDYASNNNKIVTLGLMPTDPATGYGYIQAGSSGLPQAGTVYDVKKFHEKPNIENAKKYMSQGDMFWNLGMFVGKTSVFINEFKRHAPEIVDKIEDYANAPSLSIDYAVMEKSKNISVIPCDFEWNDVGNLDIFLSIQQKHEISETKIISIDSENNIVKSNKKVVAFIGVNNLCLVEDGDVIVVVRRDQVEKVAQLSKSQI